VRNISSGASIKLRVALSLAEETVEIQQRSIYFISVYFFALYFLSLPLFFMKSDPSKDEAQTALFKDPVRTAL
jgi:hypothetical protein